MRAAWANPEWRAALLVKRQGSTQAARQKRLAENGGLDPVMPVNGIRRETYKWCQRVARAQATKIMNKLDNAGVLDDADENAKAALKTAIEIMHMPIAQKDRLVAARLVLDFTKAKPASKQELTINAAEQWLKEVTSDNGDKTDEGATGGP